MRNRREPSEHVKGKEGDREQAEPREWPPGWPAERRGPGWRGSRVTARRTRNQKFARCFREESRVFRKSVAASVATGQRFRPGSGQW